MPNINDITKPLNSFKNLSDILPDQNEFKNRINKIATDLNELSKINDELKSYSEIMLLDTNLCGNNFVVDVYKFIFRWKVYME